MDNAIEITVPLNRLTVSEQNVRKTPANVVSDAELKASLLALGLLQNLVIHEIEDGDFGVDAGRRRLKLLKELAAEGLIAEDLPLRCLLIEDPSLATEVSLVENSMRADMHPADQVEAFAQLVREGKTSAEIAVRFGMSERTVEQRLRLGNVSPVIMQAYRDGKANLDMLMAFTLRNDQKVQEEVWESLQQRGGYISDNNVRAMMLQEHVRATSGVAEFVGVEAYESAGGRVTRDLFADEDSRGIYLDDPHILVSLAEQKLAAAAEKLEGSWKWVKADMDFNYDDEAKFQKVFPDRGKLTPDEQIEMEGLDDARDMMLREGINEENRSEYNSITDRMGELRQLKSSRDTFTDEQREIAGCVVTIDYNGRLSLYEGLVRREDMPKASSRVSDKSAWRDPEKKAREQAGYSKKLMDDMRVERTKIVRSHLSGSFNEAFDLMLFQIAKEVFGTERYFNRALDVELFRDSSAYGVTEMVEVEKLPLAWLKEKDDAVAFEQMRALTNKKKQGLFAVCVATTYKGQLTIDPSLSPEVELVVDDLGIDFEAGFRPTAQNFWGRLTKGRIITVAEQVLGEEWAEAHSGDKKAALAEAMETAFAAGDEIPEGVTPEGRAAALAWTPQGFVIG